MKINVFVLYLKMCNFGKNYYWSNKLYLNVFFCVWNVFLFEKSFLKWDYVMYIFV